MGRCTQNCPIRSLSPKQAVQALELLETLLHAIFEVHYDTLAKRWETDMPPEPEDFEDDLPF